jgi:hypothetical protein
MLVLFTTILDKCNWTVEGFRYQYGAGCVYRNDDDTLGRYWNERKNLESSDKCNWTVEGLRYQYGAGCVYRNDDDTLGRYWNERKNLETKWLRCSHGFLTPRERK